jgi:hypothetical protein
MPQSPFQTSWVAGKTIQQHVVSYHFGLLGPLLPLHSLAQFEGPNFAGVLGVREDGGGPMIGSQFFCFSRLDKMVPCTTELMVPTAEEQLQAVIKLRLSFVRNGEYFQPRN